MMENTYLVIKYIYHRLKEESIVKALLVSSSSRGSETSINRHRSNIFGSFLIVAVACFGLCFFLHNSKHENCRD